jgi:hypothetical protein
MKAALAVATLGLAAAATAAGGPPALTFTPFVQTDLALGQVLWTGDRFLYLAENVPTMEQSDAAGTNLRPFATVANGLGGEEVRCAVPVTAYWPDGVYCHTPDNRVLRFARDGSAVTELAQLPGGQSDGALAFDSTGRFGYALLAATGGSASNGGDVFAVRKDGRVQKLGSYPGPGGADEITLAPKSFGRASGLLLLSIDQDGVSGRVLAIDRQGNVQVVATGLGNGDNPIVAIPPSPARRNAGGPAPGLYVPDTNSMAVFFAPAAQLAPFTGQVLVGSELEGDFWLINSTTSGFQVTQLVPSFPTGNLNLEGAAYVP